MSTVAPRLWPGGTVAIFATGPSLTQADVDYCRGKVDGVVLVNDAHRLAPWGDVLYSSDRQWWPHYQGVPSFTGLRFGIGTSVGIANPFARFPEITVLKNTGYDGLERKPSGLRTGGGNSGYAAVNLAVHLGATRILLLGYNMNWTGGRAHFFGNHPSALSQTQGHFPSWREKFRTMLEPLRQLGVEVINCTPQTSISAFPQRALREVLAEVAA